MAKPYRKPWNLLESMQPSKKITYLVWADLICSILIFASTLLSLFPFLTDSSELPIEFKIWREDSFLFPFLIASKMTYLLLCGAICITSIGLRKKLETARYRLLLLMGGYILLHIVELLVKIFVYYPELSFAIKGGGAIGGVIGSVIGFALASIVPILTIVILRDSRVRQLFSGS